MKAVQIHQFGSADVLQYETIADPQPAPGEILIKVESASVNFADILRRSNSVYPFPTTLPFIPGSEVAGTVVALGEGVDEPSIGTPVFALAGAGSTGYAQYVATHAAQVIPIPPGVSADQAAALPVAGTTALMLIREVAQLKAGESIFIPSAAGGVGSYAVQLAKVLGAGLIIGATTSTEKATFVKTLGADHIVDQSQSNWAEEVFNITEGRGVDVVLEMGGRETFLPSLRILAPFGRLVVYGMSSRDPLYFDDESIMRLFYKPSLNQSLHVFNLGIWFGMRPQVAAQAMGDLIGYVATGQVQVQTHHQLPLSQAAEAHRMIETRRATGKIILKPWLDPQ